MIAVTFLRRVFRFYSEEMAARAPNASEFRQILIRLKEVQDKLERSDQASLD